MEIMGKKIINSGLDLMIYSFDGGSKKSYEKMRPGRFKKNSFNEIYENILSFHKLKKKLKSTFPRTKIQMVLTKDTFAEQDEYFSLFKDIVDDVSVKQYTERGGKINDVGEEYLRSACGNENIEGSTINYVTKKIDPNAEIMKDPDGNLFVSKGRLPCEQPYQRMLVTYDGRVSMCCYDWGSMHPVGYVDQLAYDTFDKLQNELSCDKFDMIIDDGLHSIGANLNTLLFALDNVKLNGWIVIEDIHIPDNWYTIHYFLSKSNKYNCELIKARNAFLYVINRIL